MTNKSVITTLILSSVLAMQGCGSATMSARHDKAAEIAHPAAFLRQEFTASPYVITGWSRLTNPAEAINVYIEGDGLAWLSRSEPSLNPTPKNPLALNLAALDPAPNVIYLARPCQYTPLDRPGNNCSVRDWTTHRFSNQIINSYMQILNGLSNSNDTPRFHLIGYSGGANIAGLLAARRNDVLSLRTIAGNVDNDFFTNFHQVSAMPYSLNMANDISRLENIPQIHFVGEDDETVPVQIARNYLSKAQNTSCIKIQTMPNTGHEAGWQEKWPTLLAMTLNCNQ